MTAAEVLNQARASGVTLWAEGDALRYRGPREVLTTDLLDQIKAHKAAILAALAHPDLPGVAEDLNDTAAQDLREYFEERSAILEHDAGLPRPDAELEAARIAATLARNRRYTWASLRSAFSGYPILLSQVPDRPGPVDSLPFGTATVHVREGAKPGPASGSIVITEAELEGARKGRLVVRQGDFTDAPEVKA